MRAIIHLALAAALLPLVSLASVPKEKEPGTRSQEPASAWTPQPASRYEGILERMPFGRPPPAPAAAAATTTPPVPGIANQLVLCAINRTPGGGIAVGFVDNAQKPPHGYYLALGEESDGYTVTAADFEQESATIEKDGVSVTLRLPNSTRTPQTAAALAKVAPPPPAAELAAKAPPQAPRPPPFKTATEQILGMIASSARAGSAPPPLPISDDDDMADDTKKALTNLIVIHADDDAETVKHKETVAWIKEDMRQSITNGGDTAGSYIKRLAERQKEAEQTRKEEADRLRKLAESAAVEKVQAELKASNTRLESEGILGIEQEEILPETEAP